MTAWNKSHTTEAHVTRAFFCLVTSLEVISPGPGGCLDYSVEDLDITSLCMCSQDEPFSLGQGNDSFPGASTR